MGDQLGPKNEKKIGLNPLPFFSGNVDRKMSRTRVYLKPKDVSIPAKIAQGIVPVKDEMQNLKNPPEKSKICLIFM